MIPVASQLLLLCLNHTIVCEPPPPPPIQYYEQGKACYIDGIFHESCPPLTKPTTHTYNKDPYTKIK